MRAGNFGEALNTAAGTGLGHSAESTGPDDGAPKPRQTTGGGKGSGPSGATARTADDELDKLRHHEQPQLRQKAGGSSKQAGGGYHTTGSGPGGALTEAEFEAIKKKQATANGEEENPTQKKKKKKKRKSRLDF